MMSPDISQTVQRIIHHVQAKCNSLLFECFILLDMKSYFTIRFNCGRELVS